MLDGSPRPGFPSFADLWPCVNYLYDFFFQRSPDSQETEGRPCNVF